MWDSITIKYTLSVEFSLFPVIWLVVNCFSFYSRDKPLLDIIVNNKIYVDDAEGNPLILHGRINCKQ